MRRMLTGAAILGIVASCGLGGVVRSSLGGLHASFSHEEEPVSYTAQDYVMDGLANMWDGAENVGWGLHEENPGYWADLVGGDPIRAYSTAYSPVYPTWFNETALVAKPYYNSSKSAALYETLVSADRTVEVVFTRSGDGNSVGFPELMGGQWINIAGFVGARLLVYHEGNGFYVNPPSSSAPYAMSVSLAVEGGVCAVYVNGRFVESRTSNGISPPSNSRLLFGMNLNLVDNTRYYAIWTHSVRVYGRTLSAAEVAANHKVDRRRFFQ